MDFAARNDVEVTEMAGKIMSDYLKRRYTSNF